MVCYVEMNGLRVLLVGATGGFGSALSTAFGVAGARLVLSGRDAKRLTERRNALGCQVLAADLTADGAPEDLLAGAAELLGGLDMVVCAVGVVAFGPVSDVTDDTLRALFEVNTLLPIRLARASLGVLGRGGVIVNTPGIVARQPMAGMAAYSASKAALSAFDIALTREARRVGVRVLDLCPPHMETGLATRPLAGSPPNLPTGRDPAEMAQRVFGALESDGSEVDWS